MKLSVLTNSSVPAYKQICDQLTSQILSGQIAGGTPLPPIRTVAKQIGVSVITVRSAWDALEADGLIVTKAGSGCFAAELNENEREAIRRRALSEPLEAFVSVARSLGYHDKEIAEILAEKLN